MNTLSSLGEAVGALLKARGETITVAESSAGGLISAALLAVPGASAYFRGGAVTYTKEARFILLGTDAAAFAGIPPSSEAFAARLAELARARLETTWAIGETGATGPTGNRYGYSAGHGCIAVAGPVSRAVTLETRSGARERNMWMFASAALELLEQCLRDAGKA